MYLKSLKIHGFKSFFQKTSLDFHPGVTAIVGPNGCGKSNIVDAIRWVLGESSARALRGQQMVDVISNGTETRKPLGLAEVTLTLTDCEESLKTDFHEVSITRRIYRDGKNEYFLNQQRVRLKDLQHLLLDTGLGRPAYSILEQGKIDLLLSAKPEDRRLVFEEAAGIAKFKNQKLETLSKLKSTQENLIRLKDILSELKLQRDTSQRYAQKASQWQHLAQLNQFLETHHAWHEAKSRLEQRAKLQSQHADFLSQRQSIEESQNATLEQINATKLELQRISPQILETQQALQELQQRHFKSHQSRELNETRQEDTLKQLDQAQQDRAALEARFLQFENLMVEQDAALKEALSARETHLLLLSEQQKIHQKASQNLEANQKGMADALRESQHLQVQLEALEREIFAKQNDIEHQIEIKNSQSTEITSFEKEIFTLQAQLETLQSSHAQESDRLKTLEKNLSESKQTRLELESRLAPLEQEYHSILGEKTRLQSKLEVIQQVLSAGENLGQTEQTLLQQFPNQLHPISHFLTVKETKDLMLLETALQPHLRTQFAQDSAAALDILHWLQQQIQHSTDETSMTWNAVRLMGLPPHHGMSKSEPLSATQTLPKGVTSATALIHPASEESEAQATCLAKHLLEKTLIAEDLETLLHHRSDFPEHTWMIPDGTTFLPDGTLISGSHHDNEKSNLRLETERRELATEFDQKNASLREAEQALLDLKESIQKRSSQNQNLEDEILEKQKRRAEIESETRETEKRIQPIQLQIEVRRSSASQFDAFIENLRLQVRSAQEAVNALKKQIFPLEERLVALREQETSLQDAFTDSQAALSLTQEVLQKHQTKIALISQQKIHTESQLSSLQQEIRIKQERVTELENTLQSLKQTTFDLPDQQQIDTLESSLKTQRQSRRGLQNQLDSHQASLERSRKDHAHVTERAGAISLEISRLDLHLQTIQENLTSRHQISLQTFQPDMDQLRKTLQLPENTSESEIPWSELESLAHQSRIDLEQFGPVNLDAISEFAEIESRYQELLHQESDLENSQQNLQTILEKIDGTTRSLFEETFRAIRSHFQKTFSQLFGENALADLVLQDADQPLDCGIEIIAKPPGKRLQSISLLSGGERSMTAVALLFSIYLVKPSPFCILDELDAPLDDSNLARFLNAISIFTPQSQFIIVTHNKHTMARAEILYGVTMEERGISRPFRLQLPKHEDDTLLSPSMT